MARNLQGLLAALFLASVFAANAAQTVTLVFETNAAPRIRYGADRLAQALAAAGCKVETSAGTKAVSGVSIVIGHSSTSPEIARLRKVGQLPLPEAPLGKEGFMLSTCPDGTLAVAGADDSGTLYGCLELARRIRQSGGLPSGLRFTDAPAFVLRGPCIGMQKTYILPGRKVYEYPYTPDLFPFFYDKTFWREYLDFLAENRMNTLYLWNGHPFASLVKLPDYPDALEVSEEVFQRNVEMFRYITSECDRRGIWLVQMFYNIFLPKPLAERYRVQTQLAAPTPLAADYTRKSIAEFVRQYPNVGLMICLGEALQGLENQQAWLTETLLPGVKDGMRAAGLREEPPVVVRTHATDLEAIMPAALKIYHNLYTEAKYNGESLTTWEPRGEWQRRHQAMSRLGSTHLANVHILANLEPFRYGDQQFIQKSVQAARDRFGARGLHLYPLFYWNWPDSPDKTSPPLKQWERDWMWFEAWARYAWNPDIPAAEDRAYWVGRLADFYGPAAAEKTLDACNAAGECAPRLLRRFGITEGNRQTLSLGMTLDELVNPSKYRPYDELWKSQSPPGERLQEFAEREWNHQPHIGETPPGIIREVLDFSSNAVAAIDAAAPGVTKNRAEFERLRNDMRCIRAMSENYAAKVNAALCELRFGFSHDVRDMEQAERFLAGSLDAYRALARLTKDTYTAANSMQTSQRKIPFVGGTNGMPANYHWSQLLPLYERELADFRARVAQLRQAGVQPAATKPVAVGPWPAARFQLLSTNAETYEVRVGARPFADRRYQITRLAPELAGLTGIRFSHEEAKGGHYQPVEFEVSEPVKVLIGYFQDTRSLWLQVPSLDTAAHADERGGLEPVLLNAATIEECPGVNVHAFRYGPGRHKLELIGRGSFVVLGVVPQSAELGKRDAGIK